ncbi:MAG: peptidase M28 [Alphaproteobacteria bacterium 64-11]|nr:MAG: peptidase M28 [Alphaproteobacteria bacterium 64-11]
MSRPIPAALAMLAAMAVSILLPRASVAQPLSPAAAQWWADVSALADDANQGRMTGSPGYMRAADYVIGRFRKLGLPPAGTDGYLQSVPLVQQIVDQDASGATLTGTSGTQVIAVGSDMLITAGGGPRPGSVNAPLVFIGYGLHLPGQGHDDFAGIDLKGKVAVVLGGGPADISGAIKSNARYERNRGLAQRGAVGVISLTTPKQVEILWQRQKLLARQPGMYLADTALRETRVPFFTATFDPEKSQELFAGSGHSFAELVALADASKPLPHFAMAGRLKARIVARRSQLTSPNLVAKLPGSDPRLAREYVVVSSHLDHLGVGAPIKGDSIYNGAMDDASGVAAVLDIAHRLATGKRPRRSVLFALFTAEEKGLLGSRYFASHPTVPKRTIVADVNFDMPLPLWTLKSVYVPGEAESSLGADLRAAAGPMGIAVVPDPMPDRNVFIRADQYSFVHRGIPALFFKFGFAKGSPEFDIEHAWRANRYHSPSDDLAQPGIHKEDAVKLDALVTAVIERVANADGRPHWLAGSIFGKK